VEKPGEGNKKDEETYHSVVTIQNLDRQPEGINERKGEGKEGAAAEKGCGTHRHAGPQGARLQLKAETDSDEKNNT